MTPDAFGLDVLAFLFAVALVAGFIDAVAGGGGLLALPALLTTGITPLEALATNKLQGSFGTFAAAAYYLRSGYLDLRQMAPVILMTFIGAASGTLLVQFLNPDFLRLLTPLMLIGVVVFFALQPKLGEADRHRRIGIWPFALLFGFGIGSYDGFFGPGTGSFFALAFVLMLGHNLIKATANTKLMNFTSNIASLLFFLLNGQVIWTLGLAMALGQFLGGTLGAHLIIRHGAKFIRPLVMLMSLAMTLKLLYDSFHDH